MSHNINHNRISLPEEEYTAKLASIVERDFYPVLPSLRRDVAILKARDEGNIEKAVAIRRAARLLEAHKAEEGKEGLTALELNDFHANATSEDNAEFDVEQRRRLAEQRKVFVLTHSCSNDNAICNGDGSETPLDLQLASDQFRGSSDGNDKLVRRIERSRNSLFFTPQLPSSCSNGEDRGTVARLLQIESGDAPVDSQITIEPTSSYKVGDGSVSPSVSRQNNGSSNGHMLPPARVDMAKRRRERTILPENTRFPESDKSTLIATETSKNRVKPSFDGTDTSCAESSLDTDLDASPLPFQELHKKKIEEENSQYVNLTPRIRPGDDDEKSPIVTWGNVAATPLIIQDELSGHTSSTSEALNMPSFTMKGEGSRERLARSAEETMSKRTRLLQGKAGTKQSYGSSRKRRSSASKSSLASQNNLSLLERTKSLTPAAQSLLAKTIAKQGSSYLRGSIHAELSNSSKSRRLTHKVGSRASIALGSALRSRSSEPRRNALKSTSRLSPCMSMIKNTNKQSEIAERQKLRKSKVTHGKSLTDGLLQL